MLCVVCLCLFYIFKKKTAYEMRISDWSSDVCSSDLAPGRSGLSPRHIKSAVEDSLRRLQTDYIDLYQAHYDDLTVSLEETLAAFGDLIAEGKVRAIGLTNHGIDRFREAIETSKAQGLPRYETYQSLYNLYDRQEFEEVFAPFCRSEGIGVINFYSLAKIGRAHV